MKRTLLLMSVLAVAPLYAAAPNAASADFAVMPAITAPAEQMTAANRAQACSALAALPAATDSFIVFSNIDSLLADLKEKMGPATDPVQAAFMSVDSVALGISDGAAADLAKYAPLMGRLQGTAAWSELASLWSSSAESSVPQDLARQQEQKTLDESLAALKELRLAPIQLAVSFKGENAQQTASMLRGLALMGIMKESRNEAIVTITADGTPSADMNNISGIMVDLSKLAQGNEEAAALIGDRKIYVILSQLNNALVLTVTSDLSLIQLPADVNASLAATDKAAAFDARLDRGLITAASLSARLQRANHETNVSLLGTLADMATATFSKMGEADAASAPVYQAAAQAVQTINGQLHNLLKTGNNAATLTVWHNDKAYLVEAEADALGVTYTPGTLHHADMATSDNTLFYFEHTGTNNPNKLDGAVLYDAATKLIDGVITSMAGEDRLQAEQAKAEIEPVIPVVEKAFTALGTMGSGMGDGSALVVTKAMTQPENEGEPEMPIISWQTTLTNREALAQGWTELTAAINEFGTMMGEEEPIMNSLPVETTETDGTTYYVVGGDDDGDLVPTAAVNDTTLTLSTTARMARTLTGSGTEAPFAGAVFNINMQPIADTVRGMAKVFGDVEYDEETESVIETENHEMIQAADALDSFSKHVKNVGGSVRINNDRCHVEIIFHLR